MARRQGGLLTGLYVHIPFCAAICNYCNFNRGLFDAALKTRYVEALLAEIRGAGGAGRAGADTIFFGGGTPSLLDPLEIAGIIDACRASFDLDPHAEITLEANPETVTTERLAGYRAAGVNRLSFGVQSFRDAELRKLSRLHGAERAGAALAEARAAGFDNVSLDLMMWLPGQSVADWLESVDRAMTLAPDHLSLYLLEVYPNAPLKEEMARRQWSQAPDEDAAAMYIAAMDRLDGAGYAQYEISNVSRPGRECRHNLKYWSDGAWLGFGCGAHSTMGRARWKNVAGIEDYVERMNSGRPVAMDHELRPVEECIGDALFTGLRLTQGLDESSLAGRYGLNLWERYGVELTRFLDTGLLVREQGRTRLTRRGMLLAHEVMVVFV